MLLNTDIPRGEYTVDLKVISDTNGLKTTQINLQLQNYKNTTYGLSQVKLIFNFNNLQENLQIGLWLSLQKFVS